MSYNSAHSGVTQLIYNSRKTLLDYLKDQGYNVDDYDDFSINEVLTMITNNQLDMLVEKDDEDEFYDDGSKKVDVPKTKAYIKYHLKKSMRPQYIDEFIEDLYNLDNILNKNDTLVIVSKDEPNDSLKKYLKQIFADDNIFVVVLSVKRLQFNILNHQLVPPHKKLTKKQTKEFLEKYNITESKQIPEISRFDPTALAIGLKPGRIVHIERPSKTAVVGSYYRYCING